VVACAPESPAPTTAPEALAGATPTVEVAAAPATLPVGVDGKSPDFNSAYFAFFPQQVMAHPGDTVEFTFADTGEPHTVTLGTMADAAVQAFEKAGPTGDASEDPAVKSLPTFTVTETSLEVNQSVTQPCFQDEGPVGTAACPKQEQPAFDGQQAYYNSGWPAPDTTWSVQLADDLAPGTYRYICLVHLGAMTGQLTVVDAATDIPTAEEVAASGQAEMTALAAKLKPAIEQATTGATAEKAIAGVLSPDVMNAMDSEFLPKEISIPAGGTVTWTLMGPHTVSFDAPEDANGTRVEMANGDVVINPKAAAPEGGAGMPAPPPEAAGAPAATGSPEAGPTGEYGATPAAGGDAAASQEMPPPVPIDGGSWDGAGFHSSGAVLSFPPQLFTYSLKFTKPGTYPYKCLVHPDMQGTVTVQ
jgi:plastocyanin